MAMITINGIAFDPLDPHLQPGQETITLPDASSSDYLLLHLTGPVNQSQKAELRNLGVRILEYVPELTYLSYYEGANLELIRNLPFVSWANVYPRGFKIAPELKPRPNAPELTTLKQTTFVDANSAPQLSVNHATQTIDVVFHANVEPESVREKLAKATGLEPDDLVLGRHKVRLTVPQQYLPEIAKIDEVRHVEKVLKPKLLNDVARQVLGVGPANQEAQFQGEGQIVTVADTGFDLGDPNDVHPGFTGRVVKLYQLSRPGKHPNDANGHGTHVAGSVLGDWMSKDNTLRIRGAAPAARLIVQAMIDPTGDLRPPVDLHDLFAGPYEDGARVHNNSWGNSPGMGQYDQSAQEVDDFVWQQRDFVVCIAAGNEGTDPLGTGRVGAQTITSPGSAKNCITVGACENDRPNIGETYGSRFSADFPVPPLSTDSMTNNPEGIAAFSSRGPVQNNRIKPDVVAPGTFILSAFSRMAGNPGWLPFDSLSYFDGGTSTATPMVSGCAALVRQFLIERHQLEKPSAALVKALLINGARDLKGQFVPSESGPTPNCSEGFGRVDMAATIGPLAPTAQLIIKDEGTQLDAGEEEHTPLTVGPEASVLKATLVWTDPPGDSLQNDLDLIVRAAAGQESHGNLNAASAQFARANNVEQVAWVGVPAGDVDIIVRAFRITQFPQSYALVVRAG